MTISDTQTEIVEKLKQIDFTSLGRSEELGTDYSFKKEATKLQEINGDFMTVIENADMLRLPTDIENQIFAMGTRILEVTDKIKNFVLKGNESNAPAQHEGIKNQVTSLEQEDLKIIVPVIERINVLKLNPKEVGEKINQTLKSIKEIDAMREQAEKAKSGIDLAIKDVRDALGREGALISATDFENQATEHSELAEKWFLASVGSIVLTLILVFLMFSGIIHYFDLQSIQGEYIKIAQVSIFKLILLSIAYLVIHQSLKSYKINRHLYIVNKHRQLVLSVYPLMAKATSDQEQSNNIVAQASKAIFEQNTSGYLDGESNPNPINLTEVVTKIIDKKI